MRHERAICTECLWKSYIRSEEHKHKHHCKNQRNSLTIVSAGTVEEVKVLTSRVISRAKLYMREAKEKVVHYEYEMIGMEGTYWVNCKILRRNNDTYLIRYYKALFKEYLEDEVPKDRVREVKK